MNREYGNDITFMAISGAVIGAVGLLIGVPAVCWLISWLGGV